MGLQDRIEGILEILYDRFDVGEIITQEELVIAIEDARDVAEQTAKKYIKDMERRNILVKNNQMVYELKPKDEIEERWLP